MDISVVVPLMNEEESLQELTDWIRDVMRQHSFSYEIIFIDDGSTDDSWNIIQTISKTASDIVGIKFRRNYGKSAALHEGFQVAKGDVVITMDADLQDSPDEIPVLHDMIQNEGYDLVSGWKKKRHDPLSKTIPSKFFNRVTRWISGIELNDFNCGLKAYQNKVVKSIELYGDMHRYIPFIAKMNGFHRIGEKVVEHRARKYGSSKYGWRRMINGFLDLATVYFLGKFGKQPMHFLGTLGILFSILGFGILAYLSISKLIWGEFNIDERPLFYFGILTLIVGTQLFVGGFVAELVARNAPDRNRYQIEARISDREPALVGEE